MSALLFLLAGGAMVAGMRGSRPAALVLFLAALCLAVVWLDHHITDALPLDF